MSTGRLLDYGPQPSTGQHAWENLPAHNFHKQEVRVESQCDPDRDWKGDPDIWLYTKNNSLVAALHALVAGGGTIAVVARARVVPGEDQRVPGDNV